MVGLGNPGGQYSGTFHNVGFLAIDRLLDTRNYSEKSTNPGQLFHFDSAPLEYAGKPDAYVNKSGPIVEKWVDELELESSSILVIYDDFSIDLGTVRIRKSGSSGGHKGLDSIISSLGTEDIPRLRIGIGPLPTALDPPEFVLSSMNGDDWKKLNPVFNSIPDILQSIEDEGLSKTMSHWNGVDIDDGRR